MARSKYFLVRDLKALLQKLPDDAPVLRPGSDHSYRCATVEVGPAWYHRPTDQWSEDIGRDDEVENDRECQEMGLGVKVQSLIVY